MSKKILIVEDDLDIRETLSELLVDEGYSVEVAENGQVAIDKLKNEHALPNVILLDLMMPVKNGFEFCKEKAVDNRLSHIPIIVMSADGHIRSSKDLLSAQAYLRKPLDIFEMLTAIDTYSI